MRLSVIVPVHNGGDAFARCLGALAASSRAADEVIVVDDGSTDGSADAAGDSGARVVRLSGGPRGPAFARNRGAQAARGDVLVFIDADVMVHADTLARIERHFIEEPQTAALFGSYDTRPPAPGLVTQYKNLLHHYVHQHGRREASTFWAGCGAVRRDAFAAVGGFDERYEKPSIEDIELGARLRQAGHAIHLCPDVQATHLKRWTAANWLRTDIFGRAVPWTRLILQSGALPGDLNLDRASRLSAVAAWLLVLCLFAGIVVPWAWLGVPPALGVLLACNAGLLRFFRRERGPAFALGASGLHVVYFLYSSLTFALVAGPPLLARRALPLLLVATLCKGLLWSVIVPPWHGPDEPQHFLYAQRIAREGILRVPPSRQVPREARRMADLVRFWSAREFAARVGDGPGTARAVSGLRDPAVKRTPMTDDGGIVIVKHFTRFHPPLYYAGVALAQRPLEGASILARTFASRGVSVLLGVALTAIACLVGRELWPGREGWALALGVLVGFHPEATFLTTTITNQALELVLFSACLLVMLRWVLRGPTPGRAAALGVLTALGLLTKVSFLSVLPLLAALFVRDLLRPRGGGRGLALWLLVALPPALAVAVWFGDSVRSGGDSLVNSYGTIARRPDVRLLPYLWEYDWLGVYRSVFREYWGKFGWSGPRLPLPLVGLLTASSAAAAGAVVVWLARQAASRGSRCEPPARRFALVLLGMATLAVAAFYVYVDYRMKRDLGSFFYIQARYFVPPVVAQMAWLLLGAGLAAGNRGRDRLAWWLGAGVIALNLYALFGIVLPHYYGAGGWFGLLTKAARLHPFPPVVLAALCAALCLLCVALLIVLRSALRAGPEPEPSPTPAAAPRAVEPVAT